MNTDNHRLYVKSGSSVADFLTNTFTYSRCMSNPFLYKSETYQVIGLCMEVQNNLGYGFSEVLYKDAMEQEFENNNVSFIREAVLYVHYKGKQLKHRFSADFTVFDKIILEVKSSEDGINNNHIAQTLNYLKVSGYEVGLIINFGKRALEYKRLVC